MTDQSFPPAQKLPVCIWLTQTKYLIFDADVAAYLRAEHRICGVAVGTLPQVPQQNVFSGLPLQLMAEEVRLLVENGVAVVVDNAKQHSLARSKSSKSSDAAYRSHLRSEGLAVARSVARQIEERRRVGLAKQASQAVKKGKKARAAIVPEDLLDGEDAEAPPVPSGPNESLEEHIRSLSISSSATSSALEPYAVTPSTSNTLLNFATKSLEPIPVPVPDSYPLFRELHEQGFFLSPGLRFGCQYLAYPGDPLRFHSHFSAVSRGWAEEFDLLDIVSGGRLGTGVKKAFLMGGAVPEDERGEDGEGREVRCFSVEWAGM